MNSFFPDKEIFVSLGLQEENLFFYSVTDSTNTRAREAALCDTYNMQTMLFCANGQTKGRGTRGRSFESKSDTGLYFSLLFSLVGSPWVSNHFLHRIVDAAGLAFLAMIYLLSVIRFGFRLPCKHGST